MSGFKITELWAFIALAPDGDEGIASVWDQAEGVHKPMIGADAARLAALRPTAEQISRVTGMRIELRHFKPTGEVEIIDKRH